MVENSGVSIERSNVQRTTDVSKRWLRNNAEMLRNAGVLTGSDVALGLTFSWNPLLTALSAAGLGAATWAYYRFGNRHER